MKKHEFMMRLANELHKRSTRSLRPVRRKRPVLARMGLVQKLRGRAPKPPLAVPRTARGGGICASKCRRGFLADFKVLCILYLHDGIPSVSFADSSPLFKGEPPLLRNLVLPCPCAHHI